MRVMRAIAVSVCLSAGLAPPDCPAQNDWQYPDPYFGILEIEKSRAPAPDRHGVGPGSPRTRPRQSAIRSRASRHRHRTAAGR